MKYSFEHCCILSERLGNVDHKGAIDRNLSSEASEGLKETTMCQIRVRLMKFVQPRGADKITPPSETSTANFECTVCGRTFKRKNYLELHTEIHLNERNHECKLCGKGFNTNKNLRSHLLTHKYQKKIYNCEQCSKSFARETYLREHMKTHENMKAYKCDTCGRGFNSSCNLSRHKKIHQFPAGDSEESDTESQNLETTESDTVQTNDGDNEHSHHISERDDKVPIKPDIDTSAVPVETGDLTVKQEIVNDEDAGQCLSKDYERSLDLDKEQYDIETNNTQKSVSDDDMYKFRCDKCHRKFKTEKYWEEHLKFKCNVRPTTCEICGQEMKFRDLNLHMRFKHGQRRQFPCKVCGEKFSTKSKMKKHREMHGDKPYACETCGKAFLTRLQLEWHMNVHTGDAKYPCTKCNKVFKTITSLRGHMRGHQDTENWTCDVCGKHFTAKRKIWDHKRMHEKKEENEERKWQCTLCGVTFKRKDYLKTHMEGHLDERNYSCTVCGKRFNTKKNVRSHMRTHDTEAKYQCDMCGKSFIRKDSFRIHKMTHSSEKTHECDVCGKAFHMFSGLYHHKKIHTRDGTKTQRLKNVPIEIEAPPGMQLVIIQEETVHTT